jgi:hypothetical protein
MRKLVMTVAAVVAIGLLMSGVAEARGGKGGSKGGKSRGMKRGNRSSFAKTSGKMKNRHKGMRDRDGKKWKERGEGQNKYNDHKYRDKDRDYDGKYRGKHERKQERRHHKRRGDRDRDETPGGAETFGGGFYGDDSDE